MELMIVIAIIGIMTAVTVVSLGNTRTKKEVEVAAREVAAAIREAQNYALAGKQPGASVACGMGLVTDNDGTGYKIFYNTKANPGDDCNSIGKNYNPPNSVTLAQYNLKNSVQFPDSPINYRNKSVYFTMPHGTVYGNNGQILPANGNFPLQVGKAGTSYYYTCVSSSGNVVENGTDPCT